MNEAERQKLIQIISQGSQVLGEVDDLKGGSPQENSIRMLEMLKGEKGAYRDIVILNSACTLFATGHENSIQEGIAKSINSIDNGKALNKLNSLIKIDRTMKYAAFHLKNAKG